MGQRTERLLPPRARRLAAVVEDELRVWNRRSDIWHPHTARAGATAAANLGLVVEELAAFQREIEAEAADYDRHRPTESRPALAMFDVGAVEYLVERQAEGAGEVE